MNTFYYQYTPCITKKKKVIYRPFINIKLSNEDIEIPVLALIDSGADECCFPGIIGKDLGHNIKKGKPKTFEGVGGKVKAYLHRNFIQVEDKIVRCDIYFSEEWNDWGFGLLGQHGFFSNFKITFDYKRKLFAISY